ncbi:hypothetical protein AL480_03865 [Stenotrophomonas maltophilia]|uniref:Acb2/Tad1 domain-containing protein n=1 Tax=Stenotrophomonas maltophilia TaxID=40324 RepID=UPI000CF34FCD|nr:hypothetical protein [Stenotrophomonas maltophilia]AVH90012.1 hypothetical protein AL480_03865 [Stenotrophomonas maltophilia]HEL4115156.1 hypothetical protein [Stenotrophomonas maltophilia]
MENQHRKITGYRELSQDEIDLMNRIKAAGAVLIELQAELVGKLEQHYTPLVEADFASKKRVDDESPENENTAELRRFEAAEPLRWAAIGKTDIQTGVMALIRAVAQPAV